MKYCSAFLNVNRHVKTNIQVYFLKQSLNFKIHISSLKKKNKQVIIYNVVKALNKYLLKQNIRSYLA